MNTVLANTLGFATPPAKLPDLVLVASWPDGVEIWRVITEQGFYAVGQELADFGPEDADEYERDYASGQLAAFVVQVPAALTEECDYNEIVLGITLLRESSSRWVFSDIKWPVDQTPLERLDRAYPADIENEYAYPDELAELPAKLRWWFVDELGFEPFPLEYHGKEHRQFTSKTGALLGFPRIVSDADLVVSQQLLDPVTETSKIAQDEKKARPRALWVPGDQSAVEAARTLVQSLPLNVAGAHQSHGKWTWRIIEPPKDVADKRITLSFDPSTDMRKREAQETLGMTPEQTKGFPYGAPRTLRWALSLYRGYNIIPQFFGTSIDPNPILLLIERDILVPASQVETWLDTKLEPGQVPTPAPEIFELLDAPLWMVAPADMVEYLARMDALETWDGKL